MASDLLEEPLLNSVRLREFALAHLFVLLEPTVKPKASMIRCYQRPDSFLYGLNSSQNIINTDVDLDLPKQFDIVVGFHLRD
jgi:hypothetical protein